ncbi:hypothetical protein O983_10105 [Mycobacterium avium 09-5983]|nr:hypothetical protein O972_10730 [Mycobacterium avium subsp. avium 10-9275]ETB25723.1 hypothetical protein O983_10105 [Mycobacterium avium 09-5983]ETB41963.1 hypothetical protein N602_09545 [Mycobacterium avium subsp. hominissuis 10-5606]
MGPWIARSYLFCSRGAPSARPAGAGPPGAATPVRGDDAGIAIRISGRKARPAAARARLVGADGARLGALMIDWLISYGLAALAMRLGWFSASALATSVLVIWFLLGVVSVRLFGFTPGQLVLRLQVVTVDGRGLVGTGRAVVRGVLVGTVVPALFTDWDGRGLQDRLTATAVVRR